jgi:hypothetical protein
VKCESGSYTVFKLFHVANLFLSRLDVPLSGTCVKVGAQLHQRTRASIIRECDTLQINFVCHNKVKLSLVAGRRGP